MTPQSIVVAALVCTVAFATTGMQAEDIDTCLGKLTFENGFPSDATVSRLCNEMDFQRACQAYLWGLPAVGFHALHLAQRDTLGVKDGVVCLHVDLQDKAGMLTPNITTVYAFSFWNLKVQVPLVVDVPAGATAGGVLDIWQRPITDLGMVGPDKGKGARFLILPPGHAAVKAEGYHVFHSPTYKLWFATRALSADPKEARATLEKHQLYSWDKREKPPATKVMSVGGKAWTSAQPVDLKYWSYLAEVLAGEPVEARDGYFMAMLAPLGIEKGKKFSPDDRLKKILTEAAVVGDAMSRTIAYAKRVPGAEVWPGKRWEYALMVEVNQQGKNFPQLEERASWFYEAIGNTQAMQGKTLGAGQLYLETNKDKDGGWLDGGKPYHLHVPANVPAKQFWSITLYDNLTRGPVLTDRGSSDLSSRQDLEKNADNSVDLYFGPTKPGGGNKNWVKTNPGKGWFPYFRFYGPLEAYFDKSWQLPDIELVK
ncbi:MAG: DUF1254 domain-containing protein [Thermoguttaceae bacterium]